MENNLEEEIEIKQNYLRTEIIDKGYDPELFSEFMSKVKGEEEIELESWTQKEIEEVVQRFQKLQSEKKEEKQIKKTNFFAEDNSQTNQNNEIENTNNTIETNNNQEEKVTSNLYEESSKNINSVIPNNSSSNITEFK